MSQPITLFSPEDSKRIAALSRRVARELGLDENEVASVGELAQVHDVGRRALPEYLPHKRSPLSPGELRLLHTHTVLGAEFVAGIPSLSHLAPLVRSTHECWDGSGYPDGLRGRQIPLPCRIVYVCEAFVAMLAERPYREALEPDVVQEVFRIGSGRQFCPTVAGALLRVIVPAQPRSDEPRGDQPRSYESARPDAATRRSAERAARRDPRRVATVVYTLGALVGVAIALVLALPVESVADRCPPAGEGLVQCQVQKIGMRLSLLFLLSVLGTTSVAHFMAFTLPTLHHRWRAGEFRSDGDEAFPHEDDVLVAAHWGFVPDERSRVLRKHRFQRVA